MPATLTDEHLEALELTARGVRSEREDGDPTMFIQVGTLLELIRGYREFLRLPEVHTRIDEIRSRLTEDEATMRVLLSLHNREHPDRPIEVPAEAPKTLSDAVEAGIVLPGVDFPVTWSSTMPWKEAQERMDRIAQADKPIDPALPEEKKR